MQKNPSLSDRELEFSELRRQHPTTEYVVTTSMSVTTKTLSDDGSAVNSAYDGNILDSDDMVMLMAQPFKVIGDAMLTQLHNAQFHEPNDLIPERFSEQNFTIDPASLPNTLNEFNQMANEWIGDAQEWETDLTIDVMVRAEIHSWNDRVLIDVRVRGTIIKRPEGGGPYTPYLWIGIRQLDTEPFQSANGQLFGPKPSINLFEPAIGQNETRRVQCLSDRSGWFNIVNYLGYPLGDDISYNFDVELTLRSRELGTIEWPNDPTNADYYLGNELPIVRWTDGGAYLLPSGWAWNPFDRELWEQVAILDPNDKKKTIQDFDTWTPFGPHHLQSTTTLTDWVIPGKVIPGEYVLNISAPSIYDCHENIDTPVRVEVKVVLGKLPGRQIKWQGIVEATQTSLISQMTPYGFYNWGFEASDQFGPNPKTKGWWPGSLRIDVKNGNIRKLNSDFMPQTGFLLRDQFPPFESTAPSWSSYCLNCSHTTSKFSLFYPWEMWEGRRRFLELDYLQSFPVVVTGIDSYGECCYCEGAEVFTNDNGFILGSGMGMGCRDARHSEGDILGEEHYPGWNVGDMAVISVITEIKGGSSRPVGLTKVTSYGSMAPPTHELTIAAYEHRGWVFGTVSGCEVPTQDPWGRPVDLSI